MALIRRLFKKGVKVTQMKFCNCFFANNNKSLPYIAASIPEATGFLLAFLEVLFIYIISLLLVYLYYTHFISVTVRLWSHFKWAPYFEMQGLLEGGACFRLGAYYRNTAISHLNYSTIKPHHKMVKQTQTIHLQMPTNCLTVFD